jgi:hypothetical protein
MLLLASISHYSMEVLFALAKRTFETSTFFRVISVSRLLIHLLLPGYCLQHLLSGSRFMLLYISRFVITPRSSYFAPNYTSHHCSYRLESCRLNMSLAPEARQSLSAAACWTCIFCSGLFQTMLDVCQVSCVSR